MSFKDLKVYKRIQPLVRKFSFVRRFWLDYIVRDDEHIALQKWKRDEGEKFKLEHDLNKKSVVFDVGGHNGEWSSEIIKRYNPTIYIFEPVPEFYKALQSRFRKNKKITVMKEGLADATSKEKIALCDYSSSIYLKSERHITIQLRDIDEFIRSHKIKKIDLIKINIEGGEYVLLSRMIKTDLISKCSSIQIQFHKFIPDAIELRKKIQSKLSRTHKAAYDYPWVWELWKAK